MNYWQQRNALDLIMQEKKELEFERELLKVYQEAKTSIEEQLRVFYTLYAGDKKLTYAEAVKKLNADELNSFKKALTNYKRTLSNYNNRTTESLMKSIERDLNKVNVTRLEAIQKQISYEIENLKAYQEDRTSALLKNSYEDNYYRTMFNTQQRVGYAASFAVLNTKAIDRAVNAKFDGMSFSDRIWQEKDKLLINLNNILAQNIARGTGLTGIIQAITKITNATYYNASRLARSELNRVCGLANYDAYQETDLVEEYEYVAVLDDRTSEICADMDGKRFPKKEYAPGVTAPPMHPNCRSTTVAVIGENIGTRIAKDQEGNYIKISAATKYYDWAKEYCPENYAKYVKDNLGNYYNGKTNININKQINDVDKSHKNNINKSKK